MVYRHTTTSVVKNEPYEIGSFAPTAAAISLMPEKHEVYTDGASRKNAS